MRKIFLFFIALLFISIVQAQNVGIGTASPVASAHLEIKSTTKGFLPPRMTYAQRNLIVNPVAGLVVYCTDCDELQIYNGIIWKNMDGAAAAPPSGYPTITICGKVWMGKNLAVSNYRNGDIIPQVTDSSLWDTNFIGGGAWCWYNNDSATYSSYGKLYNFYAVRDSRGLAPQGWHISTDAEWTTLATCLGGYDIAGGALKETDTVHWASPNTAATNSSGFAGLPGGYRTNYGSYFNIGNFGRWWSPTLNSELLLFGSFRQLNYNGASFYNSLDDKAKWVFCALCEGLTICLFDYLMVTANRRILKIMSLRYELPVYKAGYDLLPEIFQFPKDFSKEYNIRLVKV